MSSVAAWQRALGAASLCFRSVCEKDLDESFERLVDLYGPLKNSLKEKLADLNRNVNGLS